MSIRPHRPKAVAFEVNETLFDIAMLRDTFRQFRPLENALP